MPFNQNRLFLMSLVVLVLTMSGCGRTHFVVLRNVPRSPSFVVIPANNYISEVAYANRIEQAIISSGVKVISRPSAAPTKEVTTEKVLGKVEGSQAAATKLTERYFEFENLTADYIVQTYATAQQVKITKRETQEVMTVLIVDTIYMTAVEWRQKIFKKALVKMGIPVMDQ